MADIAPALPDPPSLPSTQNLKTLPPPTSNLVRSLVQSIVFFIPCFFSGSMYVYVICDGPIPEKQSPKPLVYCIHFLRWGRYKKIASRMENVLIEKFMVGRPSIHVIWKAFQGMKLKNILYISSSVYWLQLIRTPIFFYNEHILLEQMTEQISPFKKTVSQLEVPF